MSRLGTWIGAVALGFGCTTADAGLHQICYEGMPENRNGVWVSNGVFGCHTDGVGYCTISRKSGLLTRSAYPLDSFVQSAGTFSYFDFSPSAGAFSAEVNFYDGSGAHLARRDCTVHARGANAGGAGHATSGAVLTGFSTDSSGLVTSGVWRLQATRSLGSNRVSLMVPADFVAVGGGATGVEAPIGAHIIESQTPFRYTGGFGSWTARSAETGGLGQPHRTTAHAIGIRIEGLASRDLAALLIHTVGHSGQPDISQPASQAWQPVVGGSVVISGGFDAYFGPT